MTFSLNNEKKKLEGCLYSKSCQRAFAGLGGGLFSKDLSRASKFLATALPGMDQTAITCLNWLPFECRWRRSTMERHLQLICGQ